MEDIIKLRSGYEAINYLRKMPETYVLKTDVPTLRVGEVQVGCEFEEAKAVVRSIDFAEGYGWTVTFE